MATYYIKNTGNDSLDGLSNTNAWQTISKVNTVWVAGTFVSGDNIYFNRGDIFYGTIVVKESGSVGSPIIISAYGTGADPIISGFTTIPSWTSVDGSIYYYDTTTESGVQNCVLFNEVNTPKGHWPNTGWNTFDSAGQYDPRTVQSNSIVDNWVGAELVERAGSQWDLFKMQIISQNGSTLTSPTIGRSSPTLGYGFFIQNDIKCLNDLGDWCFLAGRLYMYFGANNPTTYTVKISTLDRLLTSGVLYGTGYSYITCEHITFQGSTLKAVNLAYSCDNWIIQNCTFSFHGQHAIDAYYMHNTLITHNTFEGSNNTAMYIQGEGNTNTITYNNINNSGVLLGMQIGNSDDCADAVVVRDNGTSEGTKDTIMYNRVTNSGHSAMRFTLGWYYISYNFIDNFGLTRGDCGGIYTYRVTNSVIEYNIIRSSSGLSGESGGGRIDQHEYAPPDPFYVGITGIYLDDYTHTTTVRYNTVDELRDDGMMIVISDTITMHDNTFYGNGYSQFRLDESFSQSDSPPTYIRNCNIHNNIFFCTKVGRALFPYMQQCVNFSSPLANTASLIGTFDYNYYARPLDQDTDIMRCWNRPSNPTDPWDGTGYTLAEWKTLTGQDAHSTGSLVPVTDIDNVHLIYNDTLTNKNYNLSSSMKDVANTDYSGVITLLSFTSLVLIGSGTVVEEETTGELTLIIGSTPITDIKVGSTQITKVIRNGITYWQV